MSDRQVEAIAFEFHRTYEKLAPEFNYKTQKPTAVDWEDLPKNNKDLMIATVEDLLKRGVINAGQEIG